MTDESVAISITIKVEDVVMEFQEKVPINAVEETVNSLSTGLCKVFSVNSIKCIL